MCRVGHDSILNLCGRLDKHLTWGLPIEEFTRQAKADVRFHWPFISANSTQTPLEFVQDLLPVSYHLPSTVWGQDASM